MQPFMSSVFSWHGHPAMTVRYFQQPGWSWQACVGMPEAIWGGWRLRLGLTIASSRGTLNRALFGDFILKAFSIFVLAGVLSAGSGLSLADSATPGTRLAATQPTTTTVPSTTPVKRGDLPLKFEATGYFEAVDPVEIRLRLKAYVGDLTINAIATSGASVKKGDVLLEIDPVPLNKQLASAENDRMAALANVEKLEADFKLSEASEALTLKTQQNVVGDAENAVKWWEQVDGPQMLKQWDLQVKQFKDNVDDRSDELDQLKKMYKTEELTSATADIVVKRAVRGLEQAEIQHDMEKDRVKKNKTIYYPISKRAVTDALLRAKQALASLEIAQTHVKSQWKTTLFTSRTAVVTATQKVTELKSDLEKLTVVAPMEGVVWFGQMTSGNWQGGEVKTLRMGEKVMAQQNLMTLYTPGKMRVIADLAEAKYFSVPMGTVATVTPMSFPELRMEGKCDSTPRTAVVLPTGPVYPMAIAVGEVDARLIPGMKATIQLAVPPLSHVLLVPNGALVNGAVWVRENGTEKKKAVVSGHTDGKSTEIVGGLNEGEEVLTQGKP